ncbi:MAG TPA: aminotransferase class V-fold PLP-dependent enzyme, partial [Candidatus Nanoarchaeia archaeon]|nr:aminotransferase class V-fold PLP-dependent enzyme [Candidatus Nanoarchaeia archaeon]
MEIYLDNAASVPMSEKVIRKISKASREYYANPSSLHSLGLKARRALENARKEIAKEIGAKAEEIVFTSGSTESNALAIFGAAREKKKNGKNKIIISSLEHSTIYENARALEKEGFILKEIPANEEGLDLECLSKELDDKTALVSVSSIVSEVGIINDISRIAKECKRKNVLLHVDHTQGFGKINMQVKNVGIDLLSADAHKVGGPRGIGLLYVRNGV